MMTYPPEFIQHVGKAKVMSSVLLISGGLDSSSLAFLLHPDVGLTIDYGQKSVEGEITSSKVICNELCIPHDVLSISVGRIGSGRMSSHSEIKNSIYPEFWPFRNQFLITIASMYASYHNYNEIIIGTVATDKRFIDGSSEFIHKISDLVYMQEGGIMVKAPALNWTTIELIKNSKIPLSLLAWSHSCDISSLACGQCSGCIKHSLVMSELGINR